MLMGIKYKAYPTLEQKKILSQWMGCARYIWNAKCSEDRYLRGFARKFMPVGTYPPIDQAYSQYKDKELSSFLYDCPSQILRNSASNWFNTYKNFLKGICGRPKRKKKGSTGSIHLTRELFRFKKDKNGHLKLFIGTKTRDLGVLKFKRHKKVPKPASIYIRKESGTYCVSFCYNDSISEDELVNQKEHLAYLKTLPRKDLEKLTLGVDRGVVKPVQAGRATFDLSEQQKRKKLGKERYIKRCQQRLSKQRKGSSRWRRTKLKIGRAHQKISNIRNDFSHKTSHALTTGDASVIIFEDLKTKNMTRKPKAIKGAKEGQWKKNKASAKAGLNRSILDKGWHKIETYTAYKAHRAGKAFFKVSPKHTSQECAACSHTQPENRKSQALFCCTSCGYSENADINAAMVIKKRAIELILHSGTELSQRGTLRDMGRGATGKTVMANALTALS